MTTETATLLDYASVRVWHASFRNFWRSEAPPEQATRALERFVAYCGSNPNEIIDEVLKPQPSGEGLMLRTRARRKYMRLIEEFEQQEGSREIANYVRSFMNHNGGAMNPSNLK